MQVLRKIDAQSICERLLNLEPEILYASYLNATGSREAEAIKNSIVDFERLTIIVLPLHPGKETLVLAARTGCDLNEIVATAKRLPFQF